MLRSELLSPDPRLNACQDKDSAHVKPGDKGDFVNLIQRALLWIEDPPIDDAEIIKGLYGPTTTAAVLAYKTKRGIINRAYQSKPDNIVGKMTITTLDNEVLALEAETPDDFYAGSLRPTRGRFS